MSRIRLSLLLLILLSSPLAVAEPVRLLQAHDLRSLGQSASERHLPILLMISQYHCEFCERMRSEVLDPMQLSGEYKDRVLMRELMIDPGETVVNFQGRREPAESFSDRYQVFVTPTLLFLDENGNEAAERILGINTVDYLLFYIEEAIDRAKRGMEP